METKAGIRLCFEHTDKTGITADRKPVQGLRRVSYYDQINRQNAGQPSLLSEIRLCIPLVSIF